MYRRRFHDKLCVRHYASVTHTCCKHDHTCHLMEQPCRNQRTACCNRDTVIMSCSVIEQKRCQ